MNLAISVYIYLSICLYKYLSRYLSTNLVTSCLYQSVNTHIYIFFYIYMYLSIYPSPYCLNHPSILRFKPILHSVDLHKLKSFNLSIKYLRWLHSSTHSVPSPEQSSTILISIIIIINIICKIIFHLSTLIVHISRMAQLIEMNWLASIIWRLSPLHIDTGTIIVSIDTLRSARTNYY